MEKINSEPIFVLLRKKIKKTQQEIANYLEIPMPTYRNYEQQKTSPSIEVCIKLADLYNVTLDYLVGREFSNDVGYLTGEQRQFVLTFLQLDSNKQAKALGYVMALAQ